jgi:hypothetical protein
VNLAARPGQPLQFGDQAVSARLVRSFADTDGQFSAAAPDCHDRVGEAFEWQVLGVVFVVAEVPTLDGPERTHDTFG